MDAFNYRLRQNGVSNVTEDEIVSIITEDEIVSKHLEAYDKAVTLFHPAVYRYLQDRQETLSPNADGCFIAASISTSSSTDILATLTSMHTTLLW